MIRYLQARKNIKALAAQEGIPHAAAKRRLCSSGASLNPSLLALAMPMSFDPFDWGMGEVTEKTWKEAAQEMALWSLTALPLPEPGSGLSSAPDAYCALYDLSTVRRGWKLHDSTPTGPEEAAQNNWRVRGVIEACRSSVDDRTISVLVILGRCETFDIREGFLQRHFRMQAAGCTQAFIPHLYATRLVVEEAGALLPVFAAS